MNFITKNVSLDELDMNKMLSEFCFGQKCEDFLVNLIFKNKSNGTFMDIGAHDGIRFSNSFAFSRLGWKGICVEAHPDYYNICYNNRNNDLTKIINVACSNNNCEKVTFYSNYRGSLSTLNPNLNETYKKDYKGYYVDKNYSGKVQNFINGPIEIESRTINSLIEEHSDFLNTTNIDLISIDVDGSEEYVLPGFDILKYKPRIIIFEVSVVRSVVENYMQDKNYYKIYDNRLNVIYCRDIEDLKIFNDEFNKIKKQNKILISADTGHPLGN
tara:strand:+ start:384 stop:1196 length:813 start_codon:yes stop_codon:yes gene_type:complete